MKNEARKLINEYESTSNPSGKPNDPVIEVYEYIVRQTSSMSSKYSPVLNSPKVNIIKKINIAVSVLVSILVEGGIVKAPEEEKDQKESETIDGADEVGVHKESEEKDNPQETSALAVRQDSLSESQDLDPKDFTDFYEVLGVTSDSSPDDINKAWKDRRKEFSTDFNRANLSPEVKQDLDDYAQVLDAARKILLDTQIRHEYDITRTNVVKAIESENAQIPASTSIGTAGSMMIFYDLPDSHTKPTDTTVRIPHGFLDHGRIRRLSQGPQKNLAIALLLSKNKVSQERLAGIIRMLNKWGKLPTKINEQLDKASENVGKLNELAQKEEGKSTDTKIAGVLITNPDGSAMYAASNKANEFDIKEYQTLKDIPQNLLDKPSTSINFDIDPAGEVQMSLPSVNFSFLNNPVFQFAQEKFGGILEKKALNYIERAGIKVAGRNIAELGTKGLAKGGFKFLASQGTKVATKLGLQGFLQAFGSLAPGIGNAIAYVGGELIYKIGSMVRKHSGKIAAFLGVPLMLLGIAGNPLLLPLGVLVAAPYLLLHPVVSMKLAGKFALSLAIEVSIFAVVALAGIVLFTAFTIYIINNSAFVTPQGDTLRGGYGAGGGDGGGEITPGPIANGDCPLTGEYTITRPSYDYRYETGPDAGHGSNDYWGGSCPVNPYGIPIAGMKPGCLGPSYPEASANVCYGQSQKCAEYGWALDVGPTGAERTPNVILPRLCDKGMASCPDLEWTPVIGWFNCAGTDLATPSSCTGEHWGYGIIFSANGNGHDWKIYINHIDPIDLLLNPDGSVNTNIGGNTLRSGTRIGVATADLDKPGATPAERTHIHLELNIDGFPAVPDFMCGGRSGGTPGGSPDGWLVKNEMVVAIASRPNEMGVNTCDWIEQTAGPSYFVAVNANDFENETEPIGPAGFLDYLGGGFCDLDGTQCKQAPNNTRLRLKTFGITNNVQPIFFDPDRYSFIPSSYRLAVTGYSLNQQSFAFENYGLGGSQPRTVLGVERYSFTNIMGETEDRFRLYLMVLKSATIVEAKSEMISQGGTLDQILLSGGPKSTMCAWYTDTKSPIWGNSLENTEGINVANSIGFQFKGEEAIEEVYLSD